MEQLDKKDKEIIYELESNSRRPVNEIAKKVGTSKQMLNYRISRLVKRGVITKFITIIDGAKLGYVNYEVWIQLSSLAENDKRDLIEFLNKHPSIRFLVTCGGKFDLLIGLMAKNAVEFKRIFRNIQNRFPGFIRKYFLSVSSDLYFYPRSYLTGKKEERKERLFGGEPKAMRLGKVEKNILGNLSDDSRISILELAKKVGVTPKTVRAKIKALEKEKIIQGYSVITQHEKMNYHNYEILANIRNMTEENEKAFRAYCQHNHNIIYLLFVMGKWDVDINFDAKDPEEFQKMLSEFRATFDKIIIDYEYVPINEFHKMNYYPMFGQDSD